MEWLSLTTKSLVVFASVYLLLHGKLRASSHLDWLFLAYMSYSMKELSKSSGLVDFSVVVFALVTMLVVLHRGLTPETFKPNQSFVAKALADVSTKVRASKNSILKVTFTKVTKDKSRSLLNFFKPTVVFRGRLKYVMKGNTQVIGSWIKFEASTEGEARARSKSELAAIENALRMAGMMHS